MIIRRNVTSKLLGRVAVLRFGKNRWSTEKDFESVKKNASRDRFFADCRLRGNGFHGLGGAGTYDFFARRIPSLSDILTRSAKESARILCITLPR